MRKSKNLGGAAGDEYFAVTVNLGAKLGPQIYGICKAADMPMSYVLRFLLRQALNDPPEWIRNLNKKSTKNDDFSGETSR